MEILLFILIWVAGFFTGWISHARAMFHRMTQDPETTIEILKKLKQIQIEEESESQPTQSQEYRTEWHQGVCYLYDHKDNFMAQGADTIEAMKNAEKRYPKLNLTFRIKDPNESNQ